MKGNSLWNATFGACFASQVLPVRREVGSLRLSDDYYDQACEEAIAVADEALRAMERRMLESDQGEGEP